MGARVEMKVTEKEFELNIVAPLVGARVEIGVVHRDLALTLVAPLVGARVEIYGVFYSYDWATWSLPSWERGLKSFSQLVLFSYIRRSPRGSAG